MQLWQTNPLHEITLVRGEGCTVWDRSGKAYLDLLSGTWCNVLGYGHPRWLEALSNQASVLAHVGAAFPTVEVHEALAKLGEILPAALNRAVLLNTGSEAVELALKMARAATGAEGVVVIEKGYYGATTYALSLSEAGRGAPYLPYLGEAYRLPAPSCRCCPVGHSWPCDGFPCLDPLRALVDEGVDRIATVLYKPSMAAAGMIVLPPGYQGQLRELGLSSLPGQPVVYIVGAVGLLLGAYLIIVSNMALLHSGQGANAFRLTKRLVVGNIYKRMRNPMSLGFYLGSVGIGLLAGSTYFTLGTLFGAIPVHILYLKYFEEYELELRLGQSYVDYKQRVPFLLPRWSSRKTPS